MSSFLFRRATIASAGAARAFSTTSPRSIARITIVGNLADAPEAQVGGAEGNKEYVRYAVASNSGSKENRVTSWFRVTGFVEGPRRDFLLGLAKGYVMGNWKQDTETRREKLTFLVFLPSIAPWFMLRAMRASPLTQIPTDRPDKASASSSVSCQSAPSSLDVVAFQLG